MEVLRLLLGRIVLCFRFSFIKDHSKQVACLTFYLKDHWQISIYFWLHVVLWCKPHGFTTTWSSIFKCSLPVIALQNQLFLNIYIEFKSVLHWILLTNVDFALKWSLNTWRNRRCIRHKRCSGVTPLHMNNIMLSRFLRTL